jgi:hypothetical protein
MFRAAECRLLKIGSSSRRFAIAWLGFSMRNRREGVGCILQRDRLVIGMEIRREIHEGALSNLKQAMLPIAAALGGIIAPAFPIIRQGWTVSTAADIAFAIGVLALLGRSIPANIRVFLVGPCDYRRCGCPGLGTQETKLAELRRHDVYRTLRVPCGPIAARAASGDLIYCRLSTCSQCLDLPVVVRWRYAAATVHATKRAQGAVPVCRLLTRP